MFCERCKWEVSVKFISAGTVLAYLIQNALIFVTLILSAIIDNELTFDLGGMLI